ncbi:MAG: hypothetical protein MK098_02320 [Marinovum sp.]|nr:hypothetical protein [Marinovum sp.]
MTKFARAIALAAATLSFAGMSQASLTSPSEVMTPEASFQPEVLLAQARPPSGFNGNWYITPGGCAYSRTQAPGQAPMWFLIQNPHHLGLPTRPANCANTL